MADLRIAHVVRRRHRAVHRRRVGLLHGFRRQGCTEEALALHRRPLQRLPRHLVRRGRGDDELLPAQGSAAEHGRVEKGPAGGVVRSGAAHPGARSEQAPDHDPPDAVWPAAGGRSGGARLRDAANRPQRLQQPGEHAELPRKVARRRPDPARSDRRGQLRRDHGGEPRRDPALHLLDGDALRRDGPHLRRERHLAGEWPRDAIRPLAARLILGQSTLG